MRAERPNDAGHLKRSRDALRAFASRKVQSCASSGRIPRTTRAPIRLPFTAVRVSRGGFPHSSDDFLRARSRTAGQPCGYFEERDRDTSDPFLLPNTPSTSTRTLPASSPSSPALRRACTPRDAALGDWRTVRFTTHRSLQRIARASWRLVRPMPGMSGPRERVTELLTPLSRPSLDTGAAHFRGARTSDSVRSAETASTSPP